MRLLTRAGLALRVCWRTHTRAHKSAGRLQKQRTRYQQCLDATYIAAGGGTGDAERGVPGGAPGAG